MEQGSQVIKINELTVDQTLDLLWQLINKGNKAGGYSIDEAYTLKLLFENIVKLVKH